MKKGIKWLVGILIAVILLIPTYQEADDGGTREYSALLYRVTLRHSMRHENEVFGYLTGTEVSLLGFEIYNDVEFVPAS